MLAKNQPGKISPSDPVSQISSSDKHGLFYSTMTETRPVVHDLLLRLPTSVDITPQIVLLALMRTNTHSWEFLPQWKSALWNCRRSSIETISHSFSLSFLLHDCCYFSNVKYTERSSSHTVPYVLQYYNLTLFFFYFFICLTHPVSCLLMQIHLQKKKSFSSSASFQWCR